MRINRRQFGLLGGVLALEWVAGCAAGGAGRTTPTASIASSRSSGSPASSGSGTAPIATSSPATGTGSPAAGVAQALRSKTARGAAGSPATAGAALNDLGASLLALMPAADNAVLSPYSIYAVLAMARAGAKGATATQLDAVLGPFASQGGNITAVDRSVAAGLAAGRPPVGGDPQDTDLRPVTVEVANSVWTSPDLAVHQAYLDELAAGFGVGMFQIDFAADPEAARRAINSWVAEHTGKLIPELLAKGVITVHTVLTLVNAMRLSAPWTEPFELTGQPFPFSTSAGSVQATGMTWTGSLTTASGKGWSSVTVPYRGDGLAMTLLMPDEGAFPTVRAQLGTAVRAATSSKEQEQEQGQVRLVMPTFEAVSHLSLMAAMKALGVVDLFTPDADLSGVAGDPGFLRAGELIHQSVISVDEKGTEAAAATAMTMTPGSMPGGDIKTFTADRPFFYCVHDTVTGASLFLGQVTDPTA